MRSIGWISALGLVAVSVGTAMAGGTSWGGPRGQNPYAAPPCAAPGYGLAPGCCECPPNCCANVWDGYCSERGRNCVFGGHCRGSPCARPVAGCATQPACGGSNCGPAAVGSHENPAGEVVAPKPAPTPAPPLTPAAGRRMSNPRAGPRTF